MKSLVAVFETETGEREAEFRSPKDSKERAPKIVVLGRVEVSALRSAAARCRCDADEQDIDVSGRIRDFAEPQRLSDVR